MQRKDKNILWIGQTSFIGEGNVATSAYLNHAHVGLSLFKHAGASANCKFKPPGTGFLSAQVLKAAEKMI